MDCRDLAFAIADEVLAINASPAEPAPEGIPPVVSTAPMTERERFDKYLSDTWLTVEEFNEKRNCYTDHSVHMMWKAWQAAKADSSKSDGDPEGWNVTSTGAKAIEWIAVEDRLPADSHPVCIWGGTGKENVFTGKGQFRSGRWYDPSGTNELPVTHWAELSHINASGQQPQTNQTNRAKLKDGK